MKFIFIVLCILFFLAPVFSQKSECGVDFNGSELQRSNGSGSCPLLLQSWGIGCINPAGPPIVSCFQNIRIPYRVLRITNGSDLGHSTSQINSYLGFLQTTFMSYGIELYLVENYDIDNKDLFNYDGEGGTLPGCIPSVCIIRHIVYTSSGT